MRAGHYVCRRKPDTTSVEENTTFAEMRSHREARALCHQASSVGTGNARHEHLVTTAAKVPSCRQPIARRRLRWRAGHTAPSLEWTNTVPWVSQVAYMSKTRVRRVAMIARDARCERSRVTLNQRPAFPPSGLAQCSVPCVFSASAAAILSSISFPAAIISSSFARRARSSSPL